MVAKPGGTFTPLVVRFPTISPSDAFLPPTRGTSARRSSSNQTTCELLLAMFCSFMVGRYQYAFLAKRRERG